MLRASDDNRTPEWVAVSERYLSYLRAEGEGDLSRLRELLDALVTTAEATQLPEATDEEPSIIKGSADLLPSRRFPTLGRYELNGEDHYADMDITEIAEDLADALAQHAAGEPDALWEWRFGYETHWGVHHALPLLAHLVRGQPLSGPEVARD